ncbi:MAG: hypothetical protein ACI9DE_001919, partial [Halioglobus sp.]
MGQICSEDVSQSVWPGTRNCGLGVLLVTLERLA